MVPHSSLITPHSSLRFTHVVFDLDGTLVDSRVDLAIAVNQVRRSFGLPELPIEVVTGYIGEGARMLVQRALGPEHAERLDEGLRRFLADYGAHLLDHTRPYAGIAEVLVALAQRGVAMSVLTNKPAAMSRVILEGLGLAAHFVALLGGDSLPTRKPDPAGVAHLQALTGTSAERMLMVGDSLIDLRTAAAAGVGFCGVTWGFATDALRTAAPRWLIAQPHELLTVVAGSS